MLTLGRLESKDLNSIESLVSAGFKSKHRYIVNKTAEWWNTVFKDEETLDCSDSLKSIIASLKPVVDISMPGAEESSGEFGAQAQSFVDSQDELAFIDLSSTKSSRQDAGHTVSPVPSLTRMTLRGPITRKRRRDATPEVVKAKPAKRNTTPRLRHDNSQIQFAPIASSPLAEESQHFTERQQEVRQRQRENAGLYPEIRSSPRTRSRVALEEKVKESTPKQSRDKQTTPERNACYEDFINLTPTPRRGQALHLEFNDPPSSPPEPRSNPLLSEIQTRSRGKTLLDNWEFSSPPGTPSHAARQAAAVPASKPQPDLQPQPEEEPAAEPEDESAPTRSTRQSVRGKRRRKSKVGSPENVEVIPSSLAEEESVESSVAADVSSISEAEEKIPSTGELPPEDTPSIPPRPASLSTTNVQKSPKSGEGEFVDARSTPDALASNKTPAVTQEPPSDDKDTSFALSEGDESSMMRFVVELESRRCDLPFDKTNPVSSVKQGNKSSEKHIEVQDESDISPAKENRSRKRSLSPTVIPSTPLGSSIDLADSQEQSQSVAGSKRKRKRSAKYAETRRKRRKSADPTNSDRSDESQQAAAEEVASLVPVVRRSSRRNAGQKGKKLQEDTIRELPAEEPKQAKTAKASAPPTVEGRDGGDTDEELLSQLVMESNAASQSQEAESTPRIEDSMDLVDAEDEAHEETAAEKQSSAMSDTTSTLMKMLRGGLKELQEAALSRDEVYQLEDVLMDMKRELFEAERRGRN